MNIQLSRPLAFIDLETTGVNATTDRIVEIAIVKIMPDGSKLVKRKLVNPQMPIPKVTSDIHGITDDMVANAPTFKEIANEVMQFIHQCDIGGYNSNRFDIPLLVEEFLRAGLNLDITERILIDVQKIFHKKEPRNLSAAYKFYCDKNLDNAHSAEADATATWEILDAQIEKYTDIGKNLTDIVKFTGEDDIVDFARRFVKVNGVIVFNFGKHKGKAVTDVLRIEPQYYDWMQQSDFALDTKQKLSDIYKRMKLNLR